MKKVIFALFLGLVLMSCAQQKQLTVQVPVIPEPQQAIGDKLEPWLQDNDYGITVGDPVIFYNQFPIYVNGEILVKVKMYVDGVWSPTDSTVIFNFPVPARTSGRLVHVEMIDGKPSAFTIEFEEGDVNYNHIFTVQADKTFTLKSTIVLSVEGVEYKVKATIDGDGSGKCLLMVEKNLNKKSREIGGPAKGVQNIEGTKVIKTKK